MLDATERGALSPKQIDGVNTTLKGIKALNIDLPLRLMALRAKYTKKGDDVPIPRAPMLRQLIGEAQPLAVVPVSAGTEQGDE